MLKFDRLQTPPRDGDTLVEPPLADWPALLERNVQLSRERSVQLAGTPVHEVARRFRTEILGLGNDTPIIAAGHQPEFVHPGVWAKHAAVRHVCEQGGYAGLDLVVDNDAPRSNGMLVPDVDEQQIVRTRDIAFANGPAAAAYEGRPSLSPDELDRVRSELAEALGDRFEAGLLPRYLDELGRDTVPPDYVDRHVHARNAIDADLNAALAEHRVSSVFGGPFVADLLLNAERFSAAYNESLVEYRAEQQVRNPDRPLPDLGRDGDRIETALWIYQPLQARRRLWIEHRADQIDFYAGVERVGTVSESELTRGADAALGTLKPWVLRPRALTLTLWARLIVCDLFVHGIGGAKYDRITDGIFQRYYQCEPPAYACVSATLRLPLPRHPSSGRDLIAARRRVRDWRYNPDRYLEDAPDDLLAERSRLIKESEQLREAQAPRTERRQIYQAIRDVNGRLCETAPSVGERLRDDLARVEREVASNAVGDSREFFYALQPRDRLAMLAERLIAGAAQTCS